MAEYHEKVDEAGRITLPADCREQLGIGPGDAVLITEQDGRLVLEKTTLVCKLCGLPKKLHPQYDICEDCIRKIINSASK